MSLELIRESVQVSQAIGEESAQTVVENDIIVPDVKPDINRILLLDGDIYVRNTEVVTDKILISGAISYKILYISDDPARNIKSINTNANFSYDLDVAGAKNGMKCKVKCDIEHIDHNILNGRKINTKAVVKMTGKVVSEVNQDIVNGLGGLENVQVLKDNANVNCFVGENNVDFVIKENLEVPAGKPTIKEILRNDIKIVGKDYKIAENKIIAKGELNVSTLYVGDDDDQSIQYMEHEIPFSQFIDLDGVDENCGCDVRYQVIDSQFEALEDSDGELRVLGGEIGLKISASATAKRNIDVISDAYSPNAKLNLEKEPVKLEELVTENKSQVILKDTVTLQEGNPDITEVFNVLCKPSLSEYKLLDNKLLLDGMINYNVLYLSSNMEQPVFCNEQQEFFKHSVDVKGIKPDMNCEVDLDIEHCNYSMVSATEVEVRLVVSVTVRVVNQLVLPLITKVVEAPLDEKKFAFQPSIIIYFAQPGDNLWKISKKYHTTVSDVQKANNLGDDDVIDVGQQIVIPKRAM